MCHRRQVNFDREIFPNRRLIKPSFSQGLRYKNIGKSGLRVSNVALGTWSVFANGITEEQAETIIRLAYESGINLFDLSDLHSGPRAEIEMGNILKKTNWKRMTYVVTVKIYWSTKYDDLAIFRLYIERALLAQAYPAVCIHVRNYFRLSQCLHSL